MANRIKELREARGLTLEQVAEGADTTFQQVQRLEKGERRLTDKWMARLAKPLGCAPAELLSPDLAPNAPQVAQRLEHHLLIRWWDGMDASEKLLIAGMARTKGIELLTDKPKTRRSRRAR